ncbi:hypothetical protein [Metapseudomonas otitidis]|uniref:hypothetical protein n=1 Tax=Metapseudomonas otitidis TaxID=319939 RepID=UPI00244BCB9A|nr:hypothetical protein [Pseudomonas otitidis]MDG9784953.1 hypothetical protein [Pseudomonas otitidis]
MTDREMLEAAARVAGYRLEFVPDHNGNIRIHAWSGDICIEWNPLTDDGDRYRLLQALKMGIDFEDMSAIYTLDRCTCEESFKEDGDDARAVLRAAAEIGRNM